MTTILTRNYVALTFIEYFGHALFEKKNGFLRLFLAAYFASILSSKKKNLWKALMSSVIIL